MTEFVVNNYHRLDTHNRDKIVKVFTSYYEEYEAKFMPMADNPNVTLGPIRVDTRRYLEHLHRTMLQKHGKVSIYYVPWRGYDEAWIAKPDKNWEILLKESDEILWLVELIDIVEK